MTEKGRKVSVGAWRNYKRQGGKKEKKREKKRALERGVSAQFTVRRGWMGLRKEEEKLQKQTVFCSDDFEITASYCISTTNYVIEFSSNFNGFQTCVI